MVRRRIPRKKKEFEIKLEKEFPFMRQKEITGEQWEKGDYSAYDAYGCAVGEGWYNLLRGLCMDITKAYKAHNKPVDLVVVQVKEKFGGLRFYCHPEGHNPGIFAFDSLSDGQGLRIQPGKSDLHSEIAKIVFKWEKESTNVCETCGEPGTLRTELSWISTKCDSCYAKANALKEQKEHIYKEFKKNPELIIAEKQITTFTDDDGVLFEERQLIDEKRRILAKYPSELEFDSYDIPDGVHAIKANAFKDCTKLTHVHIPKTVYDANWKAFSCSRIMSISVDPDNQIYTSIDGVLFSKYKTELHGYPPEKDLTSYVVDNEVIRIWHRAFENARHLKSITIPDSVGFIGNNAFDGCSNLTGITLPDAHLNDNCRVFYKCPMLKFINVFKNNDKRFRVTNLHSIDGVLFKGPLHYSRSLKNGGEEKWTTYTLMRYPEAKHQISYTIPDSITDILEYAFADQLNLRCVEIPASVTEIGEGAFEGCHKDLVLRCFENSYAHEYAKNHAIKFELV